jgi:hypothetical protein
MRVFEGRIVYRGLHLADLDGRGRIIIGAARTRESCNTCGSKAEGKTEVLDSELQWVVELGAEKTRSVTRRDNREITYLCSVSWIGMRGCSLA